MEIITGHNRIDWIGDAQSDGAFTPLGTNSALRLDMFLCVLQSICDNDLSLSINWNPSVDSTLVGRLAIVDPVLGPNCHNWLSLIVPRNIR